MKKIILFLICMTGGVALNAGSPPPGGPPSPPAGVKPHHGGGHHPGNVATPIDGGLLTILGAAGIGYFLAKKKKQN